MEIIVIGQVKPDMDISRDPELLEDRLDSPHSETRQADIKPGLLQANFLSVLCGQAYGTINITQTHLVPRSQ